ncbi:MAG: serine/threonine-protein kinase [Actinomycetota bacterium]
MSQRRAASAPPTIAGYTYVSLLGSGGFADVFLYEQQRPRRRVAVKVLLQDMLSTGAREQFDGEANLMAQLSTHPSIVTIYEAAIATDGRPYLAMEYCPRPNLGVSYRREQMGVADALRIGIQVGGAVETTHRAGILHRDIKPANILVTEYNRPALTDFGISATTEGSSMPAEGMSIPWSPPESFEMPPSSGLTSDVWALAAAIYSLLAGRSPFEIPGGANSGADLISRIERAPLPRIGRADVPDSLERVLATAMAKSAGARYSTALAFARALQQVQTELHLAVTTVDVLEDVAVAGASGVDDDDDDPGTRIRSVVSIDPGAPSAPDATVRQARSAVRRPEEISEPARFLVPAAPASVQGANPLGGISALDHTQLRGWGEPASAPTIEATILRPAEEEAEVAPDDKAQTSHSRVGRRVAGVVLVAALCAVGFALASSGTPRTAGPAPTRGEAQPVDPVGTIVPAAKGLVGVAKGSKVSFRWANPSPQANDSYLWRLPDSFGEGAYTPGEATSVSVPRAAAGRTCIEVLIVRSGKSSIKPARLCVP